jgi:hypothetical protein
MLFANEFIFLAAYDTEGKKVLKQWGIEHLTSLISVPSSKSALDIWQV